MMTIGWLLESIEGYMASSKTKVKLHCANESCPNKGISYFREDFLRERTCGTCKKKLVPYMDKKLEKRYERARNEILELGGL